MLLNEFEPQFAGEVVLGVYKVTMGAVALDSPGVALRLVYSTKIVKPMKLKKEKDKDKKKNKDKANTSDIDSQIDSCEDLGEDQMASDLEENVPPAVDTDSDIPPSDDSGVSVNASDDSDDCDSQPQGPATGGTGAASDVDGLAAGPASGGPGPASDGPASDDPASGGLAPGHYQGASGPRIWSNGYFYIQGNRDDLKAYVCPHLLGEPPTGLGCKPTMSKTITPHTIKESRNEPTKSMIYLKAWMIWRARNAPGWLGRCAAHERAFEEMADMLYIALRALQPQSDGLLGNDYATRWLKEWAPDVVAKLRSHASGGLASGGPGGAHASGTEAKSS